MKIKHLATFALAAGISATSSAAEETVFNLDIDNTATLNYTVATTPQIAVIAENTFKVDRKVVFVLTPPTSVPSAIINTQQGTAYSLVNNSNAPIQFSLNAVDIDDETVVSIGGSNVTDTTATAIDPTYTYYVETGANSTFAAGTNSQLVGGIIDLTAGDFVDDSGTDEAIIYVVATPAVGVNDDIFAHNLTVTATESAASAAAINTTNNTSLTAGDPITADTGIWVSNVIQTVFSTDGDDRVGTGALQITSAALGITKKAIVVWDPINESSNPKAIPGAVIKYTITVTNTGSVAATAVAITDTLPAQLDLALALPAAYTDPRYTLGGSDISSNGSFSVVGQLVTFPAQTVTADDSTSGSGTDEFVVTIAATLK
jgi:uncharacterized repeat protein (TIGR01451 family)